MMHGSHVGQRVGNDGVVFSELLYLQVKSVVVMADGVGPLPPLAEEVGDVVENVGLLKQTLTVEPMNAVVLAGDAADGGAGMGRAVHHLTTSAGRRDFDTDTLLASSVSGYNLNYFGGY